MLVTGIPSGFYAYNRLDKATQNKDKSLSKLVSGLRITQSADDAAGLTITEKMRGQIRGYRMAAKNVQDGISLLQTAEGAMKEDHAILQKMRELIVQAANDTNTAREREAISGVISRLIEETESILINSEFNTRKLFLAAVDEPVIIQAGTNENQTIGIFIDVTKMPSWGYFTFAAWDLIIGTPGDPLIVDLSTAENAGRFLTVVDQAITDLSSVRSSLGAMQNRLFCSLANLQESELLMTGAESRIRDADMTKEMTNFIRQTILREASMAVLSQANQIEAENVLNLLS